jgi:class 3 adenylate cyclase/tetratricopeptide (TPR) repeat protein
VVPVCAKCGQDNPDVARFCLACGSPLAAVTAAPEEERRLITVLFTDIVGSTAKAEQMDPEDVRARLAPYYARLRTELERFGGTVEKFIGDAVVALFGAPVAHEDDPERAVRAAFAVCTAIEDLNAQDEWLDLKVRVGVNTGEALVVIGARVGEGEGMASGDVMNTAARLQSAAPVNGIVVGELTYLATRDTIEYSAVAPIAAKGKSEPVPIWQALAPRDEPRRRPLVGTTLIGRDRELEELSEQWSQVMRDGRPKTVTVLGPPGIGKSRLLAQLGQRAEEEGSVHWGRCLPYGEGITYWPVTELVKSAAGILQSDPTGTIADKLDGLIAGLGTDDLDELRAIAAALSNIVGIPTTPRGTYAARQISQAELHWGIRRAFELFSLNGPTMLVFEDLHWAEQTLIELIAFIGSREIEAPLMLVCSARPELAETAPAHVRTSERRRTITLGTLSSEQGIAFVAELLGDAALAETPVAAALIRNAGGNPLFLGESVRMLQDQGLVDAERWQSETLEDFPVPTSVQSLISARLDQLGPGAKRCAHHASVVGSVFWPGAVTHLGAGESGAVGPDLQSDLDALARRDFIGRNEVSTVANEDEYAFKHILIRDVAYGQVPKGRRAQLHVRFADWVRILPGNADEFIEIVAWHLEQACRLSREIARSPIDPPLLAAAGALADAARRAEQHEGLREAKRFYVRALEVLGDAHPERALELRLQHARTLAALGELIGAREELEACAAIAAETRQTAVRCDALVTLANIDQRQGRPGDARTRLDEALDLSRSVGSRFQIRAAFSAAALRADFEGDLDGAVDDLRRALALAEELDDPALATEGRLRIGYILFNAGDLGGSETELTRCYELAEDLGSRRDQARATLVLAAIKYYRGDLAEAERLGLQTCEWLERTAEPYFQIQNFRALGMYALARDDPLAAEQWFQQAIPIALEEGGRYALEVYRWLTEAIVRQGRIDDGADLVELAARSAPAEDLAAQAYVGIGSALVAAARGDNTGTRIGYARGLDLFEQQNMPIELAETRVSFARALASLGEISDTRSQFELARSTFAEIGADRVVRMIDRELAELAGGAVRADPAR